MNTKDFFDEWEYYEMMAEGVDVPEVRLSKKDKAPKVKFHSREFITIKGRNLVYRPYEYNRIGK